MKANLVLFLLALDVCVVNSLPIYTFFYHHDQAFSISSFNQNNNNNQHSHFLEWLAEVSPEHRDALLQAEARRRSPHRGANGINNGSNDYDSRNHWMSKARKAFKTWSAFYGIEYPTKPNPSPLPPHSSPSWMSMSYDSPEIEEVAEEWEEERKEKEDIASCGMVIVDQSANGDTTITALPCSAPSYQHRRIHGMRKPKGYFEQLRLDLTEMDMADVINKYGPEIVALCIFLLIPISVMLVELLDVLYDRWIPEEFPDRGRGRVRLMGKERQLRNLAKCEREKLVRNRTQKSWGLSRRGSKSEYLK